MAMKAKHPFPATAIHLSISMIKKVFVDDLRVGVYVTDFNTPIAHKGSIYIEPGPISRESTIKILKSWGVGQVDIDTSLGLDPETLPKNKKRKVTSPAGPNNPRPRIRPSVPLKIERNAALEVSREAMRAVEYAYQDAMRGDVPEAGQFYDIAERMYDSIHRNSDALILLGRIREKDTYTLQHSVSVCTYVLAMCQYYDMSESQSLDLAVGALFHDIGKAIIPLSVLNKPGKLTAEEVQIMKRHAEYSSELLHQVQGIPQHCVDVALHHHERYDGTGYPHGLRREQISFPVQLTSVCDVFDALVSERCYKPGLETVMGLRMIYEGGGTHFNRELAYDFIRCIGMYPVGTCVVLADGRSGVVMESTEDVKRPVVKVLYDETKRERLPRPIRVDLSKTGGEIACYSNASTLFGCTHEGQLLRKLFAV